MNARCQEPKQGKVLLLGKDDDSTAKEVFEQALLTLWKAGTAIQWHRLYPVGSYHKPVLPGYVFDRRRFWLRRDQPEPLPPSSDCPMTVTRKKVTIHEAIIRDHEIQGNNVVPGAYMIELGLMAIKEAVGQPVAKLSNIVMHKPGWVEDEIELDIEVNVQTNRFTLLTHQTSLCQGTYEKETRSPDYPGLPSFRSAAQSLNVRDFYDRVLKRAGYRYGKSLERIRAIYETEETVVVQVDQPDGQRGLNAYVLDGVFQSVLAAMHLQGLMEGEDGFYVPCFLGGMHRSGELTETSTVVIHKREMRRTGGNLTLRFSVYNEDGLGVMQFHDLVFAKMKKPSFAPNVPGGMELRTPSWTEAPIPSGKMGRTAGIAVVFTTQPAKAQALRPFYERHEQVVLVRPGEMFAYTPDEPRINGVEEADYVALFERLAQGTAGQSVSFYYLWLAEQLPSPQRVDRSLSAYDEPFQAWFTFLKVLMKESYRFDRVQAVIPTVEGQMVTPEDQGHGLVHSMVAGMVQSAKQESSRLDLRVIDFEREPMAMVDKLIAESQAAGNEALVAYRGETRWIQQWIAASLPETYRLLPWREDGVILVVGGLGGVGRAIVDRLLEEQPGRFILVGRSALDADQQEALLQWQKAGKHVTYLQADIAQPSEVEKLVARVKREHAAIHGVIHLGGIVDDQFLLHKDWASFQRTLAPKVEGTWNLHRFTQTEPLDFFVSFSSVVSVYGNAGQTDYAAANGFLDHFAQYRRKSGSPGWSLSINWPLWTGTGMGESEQVMENFTSRHLYPITQREGADLFCCMLASKPGVAQIMVCKEKEARETTMSQPMDDERTKEHQETGLQALEAYVVELVASKLGLDTEEWDEEESFFTLGLDSVILQEVMATLNTQVDNLPPTLLFDYPTVKKLRQYFQERMEKGQLDLTHFAGETDAYDEGLLDEGVERKEPVNTREIPVKVKPSESGNRGYDIAIIGMNGQFPQAPDLDTYWRNLISGRDCVEEIPSHRWDANRYYHPNPRNKGTTYGKWGGFLDGVDQFDPLFFNISPKEAEQMDPQQRLLLESVWKTMEDAGYGHPKRYTHQVIGHFAGVMWNEYSMIATEEGFAKNRYVGPGSLYWAIANRISYLLDFKGPSMAVDTACSSSLVAVHLACQAILNGDCDMAVAGGINLSLHPAKYLYLSQMGLLSTDGRCRSFGADATGYVPAEGIGTILLKPMKQAVQDGDHIYGIIRGSAVNHGGKAAGFTIPQANAHTELVLKAWQRAGVTADDLSYLECQGTGTELGDPIEINGLTQAFRRYTEARQSCPIGSVKSNIGHPEAAGGMASLMKVLLAMKHQRIPKSLHSEKKNPHIDFSRTPFYVVNDPLEWNPPEGRPRIAGVSSFGAGGANAHLIVEEYSAPVQKQDPVDGERELILLSAKNRDRLAEYVDKLAAFLQSTAEIPRLADVAYTLQTGRQHLEERIAIVAGSMGELIEKLERIGQNESDIAEVYVGNVKTKRSPKLSGAEQNRLLQERQWATVASHWVTGTNLDWWSFYQGQPRKSVSLPTYPFARKRYWIEPAAEEAEPLSSDTEPPLVPTEPPAKEKELVESTMMQQSKEPNRSLLEPLQDWLIRETSDLLKVPVEEMDIHDDLGEYGFDSMAFTDFVQRINNRYQVDLTPAVFFEYPTIYSFAEYFCRQHEDALRRVDGQTQPNVAEETSHPGKAENSPDDSKQTRVEKVEQEESLRWTGGDEAIAIIGVHGKFPQADGVDTFWENLMNTKDCISEIPEERRHWQSFREESGKANMKWGGFIDGVDRFDSSFFGISPREADLMDPQQRMFIETVWQTIEDAGYRPSDLWGSKTGVFVGVSTSDYYDLLKEHGVEIEAHTSTGTLHSILANRISYLFNFHGPSEPIDTACSASLVAINRAVHALQRGDCEWAIAGGVNLLLSPSLYISFNKAGMLSPDGRCRTFDERANGYVRGEGSGSILLKPLRRALKDRDHIYGVIRGSSVNHGGRAHSLTAPNPNAQADLLVRAYHQANLSPDRIGYIETHGTGTSLGDPIEINSLKKAFHQLYEEAGIPDTGKKHCLLGAVKTQIGHLEAAAGIAGVIKVLLALKHKQIPGNAHFRKLNPYINLEGSPFAIAEGLTEWEAVTDSEGNVLPRVAGISSFGFGGVNAHVVIEEAPPAPNPSHTNEGPHIILLSAKTADRLQAMAEQLSAYVEKTIRNQSASVTMERLAYTLQVGRESMEERLAFTVSSLEELQEKLTRFCAGETNIDGMVRGCIQDDQPHGGLLIDGEEGQAYIQMLIQNKRFTKLSQLWVSGVEVDWKRLYATVPMRLSLPTYPFSRKRHWFSSRQPTETLRASQSEGKVSVEPKPIPQVHLDDSPVPLQAEPVPTVDNKLKLALPEEMGAIPSRGVDKRPSKWTVHSHRPDGSANRREVILQQLKTLLAGTLLVSEQEIHERKTFTELGLDSILAVEFVKKINQAFGTDLETVRVYDYVTLHALAEHLDNRMDGDITFPDSPEGNEKREASRKETVVNGNRKSEIKAKLRSLLADTLYIEEQQVEEQKTFTDLGLDSILATEFVKGINRTFHMKLKAVRLYDHPTLQSLTEYILSQGDSDEPVPTGSPVEREAPKEQEQDDKAPSDPPVAVEPPSAKPAGMDVAIVGMAGKFPGADDIGQFWSNLKQGISSITEVPKERWDAQRFYDPDSSQTDKTHVKVGGFLNGIEQFDPLFFNISPSEAEYMDPQQRLFLEQAWHALEHAGYSAELLDQIKCGVYVGVMNGDYQEILQREPKRAAQAQAMTGNAQSILASRIAYLLNLKGPALQLDTACSSSLVAVHLACQSLIQGETDMMLAGGVTLYLTETPYIQMSNAGMLSPEGKCKTFDQRADGFVPGEGVGVVVLKRLQDAIRDHDTIYGVIKGSGLNQDGKTNGMTAPSAESQKALEVEVYEQYGIHPERISYVEAHGTGTKLGDPIEVQALTDAFRAFTDQSQFCAIGSVKTNIGHTSAAAGVASLIKVLLSLKHRQLPPSLHFSEENEHIRFQETPFYVNRALSDWTSDSPRCAAISSFGFSGTNAHLVVEEYQPSISPQGGKKREQHLIPLSARNPEQLQDVAQSLLEHLEQHPDLSLEDLAYTLQLGRTAFEERCIIAATGLDDVVTALTAYCQGHPSPDGVSFTCSHAPYAKKRETEAEPDPDAIQHALQTGEWEQLAEWWVSGAHLDWSLLYTDHRHRPHRVALPGYPFAKEHYWAEPQKGQGDDMDVETLHPLLDRMDPALSMAEGGIAFRTTVDSRDWMVRDHQVLGSPLFPGTGYLEMALEAGRLVTGGNPCHLKRLTWLQPLEIKDGEKAIWLVAKQTENGCSIQIFSRDASSGERILHARGELIPRSGENMNEGIVPIADVQARCTHRMESARLYQKHVERGVTYQGSFRGVQEVRWNGNEALGRIALPEKASDSSYIMHPGWLDSAFQCVSVLLEKDDASQTPVPFSVGKGNVWKPLSKQGYAYVKREEGERDRFHVTLLDEQGTVCAEWSDLTLRNLDLPLDSMLYLPHWVSSPLTTCSHPSESSRTVCMIHASDGVGDMGQALAEAYAQQGKNVVHVHLDDSEKMSRIPQVDEICFLGSMEGTSTQMETDESALAALDDEQHRGVLALFRLVKSLHERGMGHQPIQFTLVTADAYGVAADGDIQPHSASLQGFARVLAQEYYHWSVRCIDICSAERSEASLSALAERILQEPFSKKPKEITIRNGQRMERVLKPVTLPSVPQDGSPFKPKGVYLIIGGASGIGWEFSKHLARTVSAKLVLVGRSALDEVRKSQLAEIEALGGKALYLQADVCDLESMRIVNQQAKDRFGGIDGAVHSAIVLKDKTIANMGEETLTEVLAPKVRGIAVLHRVLREEKPDFLMIFSSAESFLCQAGQSNYSAASTFIDAYAQRIERQEEIPVKIINWGYWGSVGVVSSDRYNEQLGKMGIHSIEPNEGMDALERILAQGRNVSQVAVLKGEPEALRAKFNLLPEGRPPSNGTPAPVVPAQTLPPFSYDHGESLTRYQEAFRQMDQWAQRLLLQTFQRMGTFLHSGEIVERQELQRRLGITDKYHRLLDVLLDVLVQAGFLKRNTGLDTQVIMTTPLIDCAELQRELTTLTEQKERLIAEYPHIAPHLNLLSVCLHHYPDVLRGRKNEMEVLFPKGSMALVEGVYHGYPIADYFNALVAHLVKHYIEKRLERDPEAQIRILELGAGTGGTSRFVLEAIRDVSKHVRYVYTDVSSGFTQHGERVYGADYPFVQFQVLDCERPAKEQGYAPGSFDLVLSANVLHATREIGRTLQYVKELLKPNGWMLVNEATQSLSFANLTFGLTDGWWRFADETKRLPDSPLLSASLWRKVLKEGGFQDVQVWGLPDLEPDRSPHCIIVGMSDGQTDVVHTAGTSATGMDEAVLATDGEQENCTVAEEALFEWTVDYIKDVFAQVLKIPKNRLTLTDTFERVGVDSLVGMQIIKRLEEDFGSLPSTLLFEYMTVQMLAQYFVTEHRPQVLALSGFHQVVETESEPVASVELNPPEPQEASVKQEPSVSTEDIAIIGLDGCYPGAEDLDAFWDNLKQGKHSIREIPLDRWDWKAHQGQHNSKWGGFIEGADQFDPLFFHITPEDAENMDPQARLFLKTAWSAFEDAGYTEEQFQEINHEVGVFVGVMNSDYELLSGEAYGKGQVTGAHSSPWSIANRVSYRFNFFGPSLAVDTACSSSLTALHLACESLKRGECQLAIAGGVNLILHPMHYQRLSDMNMITDSPECKSFGDGADGFVAGEGVGAVVLKPLNRAIADRDPIHAVIKGSAINAGGKTSGYTVPNPNAQAQVIGNVLERTGIDPRTISYIEAHGTGTSLGDPIEVAGLSHAFASSNVAPQTCALGSVKTNIGHLESAAGIAGLTKVILQMKHQQLVPSLHAETLNPKIDFANTPFSVQQHLATWERPVIRENGQDVHAPRRAGISSFGAGGANAHVLLEEYLPPAVPESLQLDTSPQLVVLSARNEERLRAYAMKMLKYLRKQQMEPDPAFTLSRFAYTLQVGREAMAERLALVASSEKELIDQLNGYLNDDGESFSFWAGNIRKANRDWESWFGGADGAKLLERIVMSRNLQKIAQLWVAGAPIDWQALYSAGQRPQRISLPTYPFAGTRYWVKLNDCVSYDEEQVASESSPELEKSPLQSTLIRMVGEILKVDGDELDPDQQWQMDHSDTMKLIVRLSKTFGKGLDPLTIMELRSINQLAEYLEKMGVADLASTPPEASAKAEHQADHGEEQVISQLVYIVAQMLKTSEEEIDIDTDISEYGLNSINIMYLHHKLTERYGDGIEPLMIANSRTIRELASLLADQGVMEKEAK